MKLTTGRRTNLILVALFASVVGCAPSQPKLAHDVDAMKRESSPNALTARGEAFASVGDMTRAEQYFAAALREGGDPERLTRKLVAVCVADGRYPSALEHANEYLRKHPGGTDVRFAAATLKRALGDQEGAKSELTRVLRVTPEFADAHYALAQIEHDEGNVMGADAEFRAYLQIAPGGDHADEARSNLMGTVP